jgi:Arc/MetJ-type ribon-helix-helix transcriptional regulator
MGYKDVTLRLPEELVEAIEAEVLDERRAGKEHATASTVVDEAVTAWLVL